MEDVDLTMSLSLVLSSPPPDLCCQLAFHIH